MWDTSALADRIIAACAQAEEELRLEQAVYGLDARDEMALQGFLSERLKESYEVAREVHYPSTFGRKSTHRPRCDLVLTPKCRPLHLDTRLPTLFDPPDLCPPGQAMWLEVKVAFQFREGGQRHDGYGPQWRSAIVADLRKMEGDPLIAHAALLLMVFNESAEILGKDLELFGEILTREEVVAGARQVRSIPILDRIGHNVCTAALWPTIQRAVS